MSSTTCTECGAPIEGDIFLVRMDGRARPYEASAWFPLCEACALVPEDRPRYLPADRPWEPRRAQGGNPLDVAGWRWSFVCEGCGRTCRIGRPWGNLPHFCSYACREAARNVRRRVEHGERTCPQCGTVFVSTRADTVVCSGRCRVRALRARRAAAQLPDVQPLQPRWTSDENDHRPQRSEREEVPGGTRRRYRYRAACACGWRGPWQRTDVATSEDSEAHEREIDALGVARRDPDVRLLLSNPRHRERSSHHAYSGHAEVLNGWAAVVHTDARGWELTHRVADFWNEHHDQWEWDTESVPLPGVDIDDLDGAWSAGLAVWQALDRQAV